MWKWILELACGRGYYSMHVEVDTSASMWKWILELACGSGYYSKHVEVDTRAGMWKWILRLDRFYVFVK